MSSFSIGPVSVEVLVGQHTIAVVPPSQWHGDRQERPAHAALANLKADDGLRAQVSLAAGKDRPQQEHEQLLAFCRQASVEDAIAVTVDPVV